MLSLDDQAVRNWGGRDTKRLKLLPGRHSVKVRYRHTTTPGAASWPNYSGAPVFTNSTTYSTRDLRVQFDAKAGHEYVVNVEFIANYIVARMSERSPGAK